MKETPDDTGFTPIRPNPYIVGNPVRNPNMFFGREVEFTLVSERFRDSDRGGLLVFCGERRSGKTSILFQILDGRLGPDFIPVLIDMQSMAIQNEIDFLSKIAAQIQKVLEDQGLSVPPPGFQDNSKASASFLQFIQSVLDTCPGKKPILLFDEYELFENKIDAGVLSEDVLHMFSHMMEQYSVFLIFTGSRHVEQRRAPYWKILGRSLHRTISYLDRTDALRLIQQPVEGRVHYKENTDETILRLTAGQPFYTQAVCQILVDHLNTEHTHDASQEALSGVVSDIVDNAFPQMIFLWDSMERDEKLVMALLAEQLEDEKEQATAHELIALIASRAYPIPDLDQAAIGTALERLFKQELLLKDTTAPPKYAFRIDLWRHWVRRMHSVWQVMREEGIEIHRPHKRKWLMALPVAALVTIAVMAGLYLRPSQPPTEPASPPAVNQAFAHVELTSLPGATIYRDDQVVGMGTVRERIATDREYSFRIAKPGYADSSFVLHPAADETLEINVSDLRALLGSLRVETQPTGATITLDGNNQGTSPVIVDRLRTAVTHNVRASMAGFQPLAREVRLYADSLVVVSLALQPQTTDIVIVSAPNGAAIEVDGERRGTSPISLKGLHLGQHRIRATLAGHVTADSSLNVTQDLGTVALRLQVEPPGFMVMQGNYPAEIYIDGNLVVSGVQNSGARELRAGLHAVTAILTNGEKVEDRVEVQPGQTVVYDYSLKKVIRRSSTGGD